MSNRVVTLDVREEIQRGREPFSKIMRTVASLKANEDLLLIAPLEPKPLFAVLARHGFSHTAKPLENGDWEVFFSRQAGGPTPVPAIAAKPKAVGGNSLTASGTDPGVVELDARGLEPPQPLVKILEALASLPPGAKLRAHTDRRPLHLYARVEERGYTAETQEQADGSFVTQIRPR